MDDEKITEIMLGMVRKKANELYSKKLIDHGVHPGNFGTIVKADGYAKVTNDCGETLEIFLNVRNGKISEAKFTTDGCLFTIAAGSAAAEMTVGKPVRDCLQVNQSSIMAFLEAMPKDHAHCAFHAALTLHKALRNFAIKGRGYVRKPK
jgi:nitrogen fixation NifU-like protein